MNILAVAENKIFNNNKIIDNLKISRRSQTELLDKTDNIIAEIIIIDIDSIKKSSLDFVSWIKSEYPYSEIIILTSIDRISQTFDILIRHNLFFYIPKPYTDDQILKIINKANENINKKKKLLQFETHSNQELWENSPKMLKIFSTISKIAPTDANILITGESGTGKEIMAKHTHSISRRYNEQFIAVNCGAIPENLIETELFGNKRGAYTGAIDEKIGLVELANNGTLFLDEIGDLPLQMQVKLLRFLQDKSYRRVGETQERYSNVRIISATNKNLRQEIEKGNFREDLFYRLNIFHIHLPPLRDRKEALNNLIKYFLIKFNILYSKNISNLDKDALITLSSYNYPGNIRELENIIEHAVVLSDNNTLIYENLPNDIKYATQNSQYNSLYNKPILGLENNSIKKNIKNTKIKTLNECEIDYIKEVLAICENNATKAAKVLNISRATLWRKLKSDN